MMQGNFKEPGDKGFRWIGSCNLGSMMSISNQFRDSIRGRINLKAPISTGMTGPHCEPLNHHAFR